MAHCLDPRVASRVAERWPPRKTTCDGHPSNLGACQIFTGFLRLVRAFSVLFRIAARCLLENRHFAAHADLGGFPGLVRALTVLRCCHIDYWLVDIVVQQRFRITHPCPFTMGSSPHGQKNRVRICEALLAGEFRILTARRFYRESRRPHRTNTPRTGDGSRPRSAPCHAPHRAPAGAGIISGPP